MVEWLHVYVWISEHLPRVGQELFRIISDEIFPRLVRGRHVSGLFLLNWDVV